MRRGNELNYALLTMQAANHQGSLATEHSFLQVDGNNVVVTAVKHAEDDGALIVRFYEWAGKNGDVTLHLSAGAQEAFETDLMERPTGSLSVLNNAITIHTKPYEIKTVKVQFSFKPEEAAKALK